ncbi:MAG: ATP-binding cassette domain-containing protein [Chloroflexi bacterium]|nr:MAG: ATP-binding cassette domain-containing protein [Chloroflexota bacterium]MBL1197455.1 ATP-binding cassette domain-containing protein [Chloroflexota bacterium]NOH14750.1 ATP-binding cassette domain-containing protein [Chloroflexota bacterium]
MQSVVSVEKVVRRFGSGTTEVVAVKDISLEVVPGEVVLIMGPSGSGKTTLLSMLGGLLRPSEGRIQIGEDDLTLMDESQLPNIRLQHIGFIFQDFNLLSALTTLDNVALVAQLTGISRKESRKKAKVLLEQLGLGQRLDFLPHKLSGGEKQRVAIARALVNKPDMILADEPTANLDSHHGRETMRLLREVAKQEKRSVVIVSHDERIKEIADRVLWLEDGEFKDMVEMAVDPVCGMSIDILHAPATADFEGTKYYFCANGCRHEFLAAPNSFLQVDHE